MIQPTGIGNKQRRSSTKGYNGDAFGMQVDRKLSTLNLKSAGLEHGQGNPSGFQVHHLNHSATVT